MKHCPNCRKLIQQEWKTCPYWSEKLRKYKKDVAPLISFSKDNMIEKLLKQTIMEIGNINLSVTIEEKLNTEYAPKCFDEALAIEGIGKNE